MKKAFVKIFCQEISFFLNTVSTRETKQNFLNGLIFLSKATFFFFKTYKKCPVCTEYKKFFETNEW